MCGMWSLAFIPARLNPLGVRKGVVRRIRHHNVGEAG